MQGELENGKEVRFVNGGSLAKAAYDFGCVSPKEHLHVYIAPIQGVEFVCSGKSLSREEQLEAAELFPKLVAERNAEMQALRDRLVNPESGDALIDERTDHGRIGEKNTAPTDIVRALGLWVWGRHVSWGEVKQEIVRLRLRSSKEDS